MTDELRLDLLGGARLSAGESTHDRLERKAAALLAYVALERDATRARIAALLWPDAEHGTARNNLAQAVARLKKLAGRAVVLGKDVLSLDRVRVDVTELDLAVQRGGVVTSFPLAPETLLGGYDFADCPELLEWLDWRRDSLRRTFLRALELESRRLEAERDFGAAIERAEDALRLDRLGEVRYVRLMRLQIARGDRARALDVFAECERVLGEELGTSPSADTRELAKKLRQSSSSPAASKEERAPSLRYDHPPFVGRAREWATADRAHTTGHTLFVSGEPGIGKTRFLLELANAKGRYLLVEGRPGDAAVPFATLARGLRQLIRAGSPTLPGWARLELSRILPELQVESPPTTWSEADRLRLFEAALELFRHARGEANTFVFDDLQYSDAASVEAFDYVLGRVRHDPKSTLVVMIGFRRGELTRETGTWVDRTLESGRATHIELSGLEPGATWELAEALTGDARDRVPDLERISLGNPLFVSEILRSQKSGRGAVGIPPRIERLLERRLERLSPAALRLARVAAILGSDLEVEVAARVMDLEPLDLDEPWAELEREQVVRDCRFVHDLLAETLEKSLSRALFSYLHGRVANQLAKRDASPAIIARHFMLAEDDLGAAPHLMRAAEQLRTLSRLAEAADAFERAGDIFLEHGDLRNAMTGWFAVGRLMRAVDRGERFQRLANRMALHARNDAERARALVVQAFYDEIRDDLESAARHAGEALELATVLGHAIPRAEALRIVFIVRTRQGRLRDAEVALGDFTEMCRALGGPEAELAALWHGAELYMASDQHPKAIELCTRADRLIEQMGQFGYLRVVMQGSIAHSYLALGRMSDAAAILGSDPAPGVPAAVRVRVEWCLALLDIASGRYRDADERLLRVLQSVTNWAWESRVRCVRGALFCWLGAVTIGRNELLIVIDDERTDAFTRIDAMLALARENPETLSKERQSFIEHSGSPLQRVSLACFESRSASEAELTRLLLEAEELGARGHVIALSSALAELCSKNGEHERAKELADRCFSEAERDPLVFPELERIAFVRATVHERADGEARAAWADAERAALRGDVPKEWEQSYPERNPVIAAILRSAC